MKYDITLRAIVLKCSSKPASGASNRIVCFEEKFLLTTGILLFSVAFGSKKCLISSRCRECRP